MITGGTPMTMETPMFFHYIHTAYMYTIVHIYTHTNSVHMTEPFIRKIVGGYLALPSLSMFVNSGVAYH